MKRKIIVLLIIMLITSNIAYGSVGIEEETRSYLLGDYETGEILVAHNIDEVVELASISKLLTYYVVMDEVSKGNLSLDEKVIIDEDIASVKGSSLKVKEGEEYTIKELLEAAMIVSANDATYALAKTISGTEEEFVELMKDKAKELNLLNARIYNSTGLPIYDRDVQNMMTTREIFLLSQSLIRQYPQVLESTRIPYIEYIERNYAESNTNPLLNMIDGVDGLKTGFTNRAGYCYVSTFNIKERPMETKDLRLIGIVMGTKGLQERKELGRRLAQYGLDNYSNQVILHKDKLLDTIILPKSEQIEIGIYPKEGFNQLINNGDDIEIVLDIKEEYELPIKKDSSIGEVVIYRNKKEVFREDIIVKEDIKKAGIFTLINRFFKDLLIKVEEVFNKRPIFQKI